MCVPEKKQDHGSCCSLGSVAEVCGNDRLGAHVAARDLGELGLIPEDEYPVDKFDEFLNLTRQHHHTHSLCAEALESGIDFPLRHDVDSSGGVVEEKHVRLGREP